MTFSATTDPVHPIGDVWISAATTPDTPRSIVTTPNARLLGFTSDSSHALYLANWTDTTTEGGSGDLTAVDRDGGITVIAPRTVASVLPLAGSNVVYASNETTGSAPYVSVFDLSLVDVSKPVPSIVAHGAGDWLFDPTATTLVYLGDRMGGDSSVYAMRLPAP